MGIEQTMLAGRFGDFVRDRHEAQGTLAGPEVPFPLSQDLRDAVSHHLIPLALLARADGSVADAERKAMVDHAVAILAKSGHPVSDADIGKLTDYITGFRPALMQLDPALHRLDCENADTKIAFLGAARAVASADGRIDPAEAHLLDEMKLEFAKV